MSRNTDPLVEELRRWGHAQANRYAFSRAERTKHVLEHARDYAPQTVERAMRDLVARDGGERRRFMAARSGVDSMQILPTWAVDPVRSGNDADRPHDNPEIAVDMGIPDDLRWVDRALASIRRQSPLRALVVHVEFTVAASQAAKAHMVAEQYGGRFTVWQYRKELARAIDWMGGRMAA